MKVVKRNIHGVKTTRFEFEDGTVWEEVDLPPEFYPKNSKGDYPKAQGMLLTTKKDKHGI